jgi:L-seryl-tRNA(Ser) seleniumtransferase
MATKTSDLLNSIPSAAELLERPPVKALVERWNRSIVAGGLRSFLDDLQSDLRRRATDAGLPSIRELAERAARHVIHLQQPSLRPTINATGRVLDSSWAGVPLADQALERMVSLGRGYVGTAASSSGDAATAIARLTGAEAATVVHSYAGAIWLTLSTLAAGREVVIGRAETGDLELGCSMLSMSASVSTRLKEVGSANRASVSDYEAAISKSTAAIVTHEPDGYRVVGDVGSADLEELVALARDRELPLVQAVGSAPLVGGLPIVGDKMRSSAEAIAAGANLVIVRGNGLVGGPPCGIIVGHRDLVRRIEEHPLIAAWQPSAIASAALSATIQLYDNISQLPETLPILQLLTASVDNLRLRAERLTPQLAQLSGIKSAEAIATENSLGAARFSDVVLPSNVVALSVTGDDPRELDKRLRSAPLPLFARVEGQRLVLDLRAVFPRQDQQIVDVLSGCAAVAAPTATDLTTATV